MRLLQQAVSAVYAHHRQRAKSTQRCKRIGKRIGEGSGTRRVSGVLHVALTWEHRQHQAAQVSRQRRREEELRECYGRRLLLVGSAERTVLINSR